MDPLFIFIIMVIVAILGAIRLRVTVFSEKQRASKFWFMICAGGFFYLR